MVQNEGSQEEEEGDKNVNRNSEWIIQEEINAN